MAGNDIKTRDSLADLDRYRLQLEQNVAKLWASLRHWQTWEIEYEGMKEEILELGEVHSSSDLENIGDVQNELLTPKERKLLLLDDRGNVRESQQVISLLSRRIDYVQQNIRTVSLLLDKAQEKHAAAQVLSQPEVRNEEGLPLKEIHEELDDEGNVISSAVSEPGQAAPQLLESLRKAGVKDLPSKTEDESPTVQIPEKVQQALADNKTKADSSKTSPNATTAEGSSSSQAKGKKPRNPRKSVSFTADTKTESLLEHKSKTKIPTVKPVDPVIPVVDGSPENAAIHHQPVIPANESPEDAALRRQMIQYNMSEVNNIVAEMNLDDEASDASYSDADGEEGIPDDSSLDEDEDKFGRTKRRVLSDDYLAEMRALEQKLNAKAIQNVGPNTPPEASTTSSGHDENETEPLTPPKSNGIIKTPKPPTTKGVRFAEDLDIQPSPPSPPAPSTSPHPPNPNPIHANTIIERPYSNTSTTPSEPDEFDSALLRQEVKTEYNKLRNRMIQRQGGFVAPEDDGPEVPLTEAEGGPKKLSRFKAARLGRGSSSTA